MQRRQSGIGGKRHKRQCLTSKLTDATDEHLDMLTKKLMQHQDKNIHIERF